MSKRAQIEQLEQRGLREQQLAEALRPIRESETWSFLIRSLQGAREHVMRGHLQALMRGREINQRQLDYDRGYWDGVVAVLNAPEQALTQFEKTLEKLQTLKGIDQLEREGVSESV